MKNKASIVAVACFALFSAVPASAADEAPAEGKRIATALGLRWEGPEERLRVGQKANAVVENPTKLSRHGVTAKENDRVVVTLTGRNSFTLLHEGSNRTLKLTIDAQGAVTQAH